MCDHIYKYRHGLFQRGTQWADGPEMVTQCPICPGGRYTYRYNVTGQEGTLWWHAHSSMLRATVHGAIVIRPRNGDHGYPFPKPHKEEIIMLGTYYWPPKFYPSHQGRAGINRGPVRKSKVGPTRQAKHYYQV